MKTRGILILVATLFAIAPQFAHAQQLLPEDQATQQPEFFSFRARLITAVARRDAAAVLAAVHPNIKNSFGGDDGIEAFKKKWRLEDPASPFWEEFAVVLALGGVFQSENSFAAPYVFSNWPNTVDAFENFAVIGGNVRVRQSPEASSATLGALSFVLVRAASDKNPDDGWTAVRFSDGRTGYINSAYVRSAVDYRAFFQKANASWQLLLFLAGD